MKKKHFKVFQTYILPLLTCLLVTIRKMDGIADIW